MLVLPYKADIDLFRFPFLTVLVCVVCAIVFYMQSTSYSESIQYTNEYCELRGDRLFHIALKKAYSEDYSLDDHENCVRFLIETHNAEDPEGHIDQLVSKSARMSGQSKRKSRKIVSYQLNKKYDSYEIYAVDSFTNSISYKPESWNIYNMFSYVFAHADIFHIVGNLFFFFAFSATVEIILGLRLYTLSFAVISLGTAILYSVYTMGSPNPLPTVGLSGVVYGMMGLFVYFTPWINIRFFAWIIIMFFRFSIPAWIIVGIYFSIDTYNLVNSEELGGVNLVAHVSGGLIGYFMGMLFFRGKKRMVKKELKNAGI